MNWIAKNYYEKEYVQELIISQLQRRYLSLKIQREECGLIWVMRGLTTYKKSHLINVFKIEKLFKCFYFCLYFDLAKFNEKQPYITIEPGIKRDEQLELLSENFFDYAIGIDWAIDIDCKDDLNKAYKDTKKIKKLLDDWQIPYSLKFSGKKGFHFLVDYSHFQNSGFSITEQIDREIKIYENITRQLKINTIDRSIYEKRRILKCAYALDGEYIALPLSDSQFENFDKEMCHIDNVLKNIILKNRGLLTRPGSDEMLIQFFKIWGKLE